MKVYLQAAAGCLGLCLLSLGVQVHAGSASSLDLAVSDVFPVTRADFDFTENPQLLLLAQASPSSEAVQAWESALPPSNAFDWVQTTSGEWLKGELNELYSGSLVFDSDEFGLQTIDWDDVAQFRGHGKKSVRIDAPDEPLTVDGFVNVTKDKIFIETDSGTQEFARSRLISITPGAVKEIDKWSAKISLGLNFSSGNTDQTDMATKADIKRQTADDRLVFDYLGNFTVSNNNQTVNNHRASIYYDIFATRQYFWRPVFAEYFRDPFQNLDYRTTIGFGGGYHIIDTPKTNWDVSGGPGYRTTRYVSVASGDDQKVTTPALVIGTVYDTELTKDIDFNASYNVGIVNEASGTYTHHAIATVEIELTDIFDFDVSFVWDRTQDPQVRSDGTQPDQDDFKLMFTLGVDI